MALTQGARNKIKSIVQAAKKLLMNEFESQLQQYYGIRPDGSCLLVEELTAREASVIETARLLRQRLHYLEEGIAGKDKAPEAVRQLIREQAFTILNRFSAIRMSEERNIIRESIRKGYNSEGFLVYDQLTGGAKTAEQFTRYNWYIGHVFDELALDLPAVFDRFSPYALLFPSEKVLLELLSIINDENVNIYREAGHQPINLWIEDETIGWIYQYYNSREEISEMREASSAPRNSRELAVRNQFFTPRYVVQFLVDNSLGRQWYEMTQGKTALVDSCQYMVKRDQEIFLEKGEKIPDAKIKGTNYIEFRQLKDPREILMLDPACGSMHFGLYCFDLFEQIYLEAWDNYPELLTDLRDKYLREEFIKRIPKYILRYNIHGVDIDPRAIQIAGLSLWLRAQKSYDRLGLQPSERPAISKSNLVIAEPMPGDVNLLSEFTKSLPGPIGKLVRVIWEKMQLAGETGLLLKIEEELKKEIELAREEYEEYKNSSAQVSLFDSPAESKAAEMAAVYGKGQYITEDFFDTAEEEVLKALKSFAENAEGEDAFQKLLFAEDTARGFAFIELCRKRYDVIVMNPPFGARSSNSLLILREYYPLSSDNLYIDFMIRCDEISTSQGLVASITDRSYINKKSYSNFRKDFLIEERKLKFYLDLGAGILDGANVEVSGQVFTKTKCNNESNFLNLSESNSKDIDLIEKLKNEIINIDVSNFKNFPSCAFVYDLEKTLLDQFSNGIPIEENQFEVFSGLKSANAEFTNRLFWEIDIKKIGMNRAWTLFQNGSPYSPFYYGCYMVLISDNGEFNSVMAHSSARITHIDKYYKKGLSYGKRTDYMYAYIMREGQVFSMEGQAVFPKEEVGIWKSMAILNSIPYQSIANKLAGQHKPAGYVNPIKLKLEDFNFDETLIQEVCCNLQKLDFSNELSSEFICPAALNSMFSGHPYLEESVHASIKWKMKIEKDANLTLEMINKSFCENVSYKTTDYLVRYVNYHKQLTGHIISEKNEYLSILSYLVGCYFGRWDMRISNHFNCEIEDLFTPASFKSFNDQQSLEYFVVEKSTNNLAEHLSAYISKSKLEELCIALGCGFLDELFLNNTFLDYHLVNYQKHRRIAPIYWALATKSNSYVVWVYYPTLSENTLFSIVNELLDPKIKEIAKEVEVLEMNGTAKELNEQKEFLAELEDFKEDLLRVTQLPYKPNQDDGVLITAAPLHNLFRHSKWKKDTQDCWKALEKGEYDWAHLAFSIWPDRVRKKCIKDLSMAIAHGLENICDVKRKEKAEKKIEEIKADVQSKLI
jgi:hypothetical protein